MIVLFKANLNKAINNFLPFLLSQRERRVATKLRTLASLQCGPGFIQAHYHKINYVSYVCCWFSLLWGFFSECSGFPSDWKPNIVKLQFYSTCFNFMAFIAPLSLSLNVAIHVFVFIIILKGLHVQYNVHILSLSFFPIIYCDQRSLKAPHNGI